MAKNHAIQRLAGLTRDARKSSSSSGRLMTPSPVRTTSLFYTNECSAGNADHSDRIEMEMARQLVDATGRSPAKTHLRKVLKGCLRDRPPVPETAPAAG
jgi:hypothetical protein